MSSAAISLPPASPAKAPKKRSKSVRRNTGPTVSDLILKAVSASKERGGMSLAALKKTLQAGGYDVVKNKARILIAIRRLVANKALVQTKGSGASGSFKVNKNEFDLLNTKCCPKAFLEEIVLHLWTALKRSTHELVCLCVFL
uniref:Si:ch211-103n10.5 n=1 Tax=Myripristis murdjan TaxID=586833 RepID=A0A667XIW2_9TELE